MKSTNTYGATLDLAVLTPTVQAFDLNFNYGTGELTWTRGNGKKVLILIRENGSVNHPFDQVTYQVGDTICSSEVIYKGTGTSVILNLDPGNYTIQAFEFNGQAGLEKYLRTISISNPIDIEVTEGVEGIGSMIIESTFIVG